MKELASDARVFVVQGLVCRWELQSRDHEGAGFVRKEAQWMTSSAELAKALGAMCADFVGKLWHRLARATGGNQAELSATCPPRLVREVLKAFEKQVQKDGFEMHSFAAGPRNDEEELPGGGGATSTLTTSRAAPWMRTWCAQDG